MACVAISGPAADLEGCLRLEAQQRNESMRAALQGMRAELKAELQEELLTEREHRRKAESTAEELATQIRTLMAQNTPDGKVPDTLAQMLNAREVCDEPLHMALPESREDSGGLHHMSSQKQLLDSGGYRSLELMSVEVLKKESFDQKDLTEDMWGIAIMLLARDLPEISSGINLRPHLVRFFYGSMCVLLNLFLQLAVLHWVAIYIVGNAVWTVQGQYAKFHRDIFNEAGEFQQHAWMNWDGPRDELCDAVINKKLFLGCILFLWIGRMLGEFKTCQRMAKEVWAVPSAPPGAKLFDCIVSRDACHHGIDVVDVIALTKGIRFSIYVLAIVPKVVVCVLLAGLGCQWLTATLSFSDLILNALALEFIVDIDENILEFFLPLRVKTRLGFTKFAYPCSEEKTTAEADQALVDDYVRNIMYFLVAVTITTVWVLYLQQVLPYHQFDIDPHCGEWYENQFSQKCWFFEKGCFPKGMQTAPHDYNEMPPQ